MAGRRHYLIDGYNVVHAIARGPLRREDLEAARETLVRQLRALVGRRSAVTVVFDSRSPDAGESPPAPRGMTGAIEVIYAPDADRAIVEAVRRSRDPRSCVVVSRDREVTGKAQQLGAALLSVGDLLKRLASNLDDLHDPAEPPEKYGLDDEPDDA